MVPCSDVDDIVEVRVGWSVRAVVDVGVYEWYIIIGCVHMHVLYMIVSHQKLMSRPKLISS